MTSLITGVLQRTELAEAAVPDATDRPLLKPGMQADEVVDLRLELNLAGAVPALPMGSVYDEKVHTAVVEFQRSVGLEPDGHVGPKTWGALDAIARDRTLTKDERTAVVASLVAARRAMRAGDFIGAAAVLRALYSIPNLSAETRPPVLLALGECEHHLGNFDEATGLYLEYVTAPAIDDSDRRIASQRLHEARQKQPPGKLEADITGERRQALAEAGGPEATDRPLLKPGMQADEVVDLRLELNIAGAVPALPMGSVYDDRVHTAVLDFQRSVGLVPDGHVGPKTWGALDFIGRDRVPSKAQRDAVSAGFGAAIKAMEAGDFIAAAVTLRGLYSTGSLPPEARSSLIRALGESEHALGNFAEATSLYQELLALPAIDDADRRMASQRLREARLRLPRGRLESSISEQRKQAYVDQGRPEATDRPLLRPGMQADEVVDLRLELNLAGAVPALPMGSVYDERVRKPSSTSSARSDWFPTGTSARRPGAHSTTSGATAPLRSWSATHSSPASSLHAGRCAQASSSARPPSCAGSMPP